MTGTGILTVPIATTTGRSGFGPSLALSYDSGAGNGAFGLGWNLALPNISRRTDKGLPRYRDTEESDVFILSGAEDLVPIPTAAETIRDGFRVIRYRPRIEGLFARVERWTRVSDGDTHWRSISRDNVTTLYGKDAASRVADAQRQLNQVSKASTDFQKALGQNANSEPAKTGLAKARARLPELYAALGKDDIAKAQEAITPPAGAEKGAPSQQAMQKAVGFLEKATQDYDQAVGLAPENTDFKSGLTEAQQMLAQYRDQLDKQMQANAKQQGQDPNAQAQANAPAQAADQQGEAAEPGQTLSMTDLRGSQAPPRTTDKFWDKKIRDW